MPISRIKTDGIQDDAITSAKIGVDVIVADDLAANSVTVSELTDGAVTGAKLANNLNYDSGTLYLDSTNNRVGIGTTSPSKELHVKGDIDVEGGTGGVAVLRFKAEEIHGTVEGINIGNNFGGLAFKTNNNGTVAEKVRIDNAGNVGIGVSSMTNKLVLPNASYFAMQDTGGAESLAIRANSSNAMELLTGGGVRMSILSDGKLGLGETNPSSFLHLKKSDATTYDATDADGQVGIGPTIYLENPANSNITVGGQIVFGMRSTEAQARIGATGGAAPELTFGTGDVERMRIDSNGRVGIGTDNPNTPVQVQNDSDTDYNPLSAAFNNILGLKNSTSGALNNSIMSFTTESNGEWYIGGVQNSSNNASDFVFVSRDSGSRAERMRITSNGDINHHTSGSFKIYRFNSSTNPYLNVGSIGCAYFNASSTDANAYAIVTNKDSSSTMHHICFKNINSVVGTISTSGSSTSYNTSSDYRLKDNVVEMTDATTRLKQLQPKRFNFIADADTTVDGFLAHEVQSVVPEAITGTHDEVDDDGNPVYQGIDQSKLVPLLVKTIQELEARITALESN